MCFPDAIKTMPAPTSLDQLIPQTDASHLWGPSFESYYSVEGCQLCRILTTSFFSLVPADINIFDLKISKCCCGSRKSTKSLLPEAFARVPDFKMLLWPPRGSMFRCMHHYVYHCYHQNHKKMTRISIKDEVFPFWSCAPICILLQNR